MQLLLLSVKPCQKSIALKTTARFVLNICDMSGSSNPRGELWQLKGSRAVVLQGSRVDAIPGCSRNSPACWCSCCAATPLPTPPLGTPLVLQQKQKKSLLCKLCWIAQLFYLFGPTPRFWVLFLLLKEQGMKGGNYPLTFLSCCTLTT